MLRECPLTDDSVGFDGSPANGLNRCFSPVAPRPGQGLLSDHVAAAQPWRRERVFVPLCGHSPKSILAHRSGSERSFILHSVLAGTKQSS